jgi:hypothetical protein
MKKFKTIVASISVGLVTCGIATSIIVANSSHQQGHKEYKETVKTPTTKTLSQLKEDDVIVEVKFTGNDTNLGDHEVNESR